MLATEVVHSQAVFVSFEHRGPARSGGPSRE